jgi:hypothetical protein
MLIALYFKHLIADLLDTLLTLFLKVLPVFPGAHISYSSRRAELPGWGDAWRVGDAFYLQVGGFELLLDLPAEQVKA